MYQSDHTENVKDSIKIAVLSDTHGFLPQSVLALFESSSLDAIVHAGDIGPEHIIWQLELTAPVIVVRGNCDYLPSLRSLPVAVKRKLGNTLLVLTHKPRNLSLALNKLGRQDLASPFILGIHGHTHVPNLEQRNQGLMILCPGSPGEPRGGSKPTIAMVTLAQAESQLPPQIEFIELN